MMISQRVPRRGSLGMGMGMGMRIWRGMSNGNGGVVLSTMSSSLRSSGQMAVSLLPARRELSSISGNSRLRFGSKSVVGLRGSAGLDITQEGNLGCGWMGRGWRRGLATSAYVEGPEFPALLTQTIPEHFASIVSQHGDRTAVISRHQGKRLSYRELDELSDVVAHGLRENGVRMGDRVCVMLGNTWEFAVLTYAVFKLGAILVPLNPAFTSNQVISALTHLSSTHLVLSTTTKLPYKQPRSNIPLLSALLPSPTLPTSLIPSLKSVILVDNNPSTTSTTTSTNHQFPSTTPFASLLTPQHTGKITPDEPLKTSDVINIQFTSGTTSMPKAACLTHSSILNNGFFIAERMGLGVGDVVCCPPPLFHCFGCVLGYMATATTGATILFPDEAFNPEATLLAIQEEKATALYGVATMFIAELELLANGTVPYTGFEHLRTGIAAGSSVPSSLMSRLHNTLNLTGLTICYGMTETSPVSCMTTPTDPIEKRLNTVGKVMPHMIAKVVDVHDHTKILARGEKGELVVGGCGVMKGYWGDEERTREVLVVEPASNPTANAETETTTSISTIGRTPEGEIRWMHTGDEALIDADGYVSITGRIKDLIIRGGENIHPLEIENVIFGVEGVREVSVVGLPDERLGEGVGAFVVVREGWKAGEGDGVWVDGEVVAGKKGVGKVEATEGKVITKGDIQRWVRERLSGHLVPKWVFWVKEYPKTASGKIQKFKLREMGIEMLKRGG